LVKEYQMPTYEHRAVPASQLINIHHQQSKRFGFKFAEKDFNRLAYACTSFKATKNPSDVRYIAGSYMCSMQPLSCLINSLLKVLKPKLDHLWAKVLQNPSIPHVQIWMLKNSMEIPDRIKDSIAHVLI